MSLFMESIHTSQLKSHNPIINQEPNPVIPPRSQMKNFPVFATPVYPYIDTYRIL